MSENQPPILSKVENNIGWITLNRPQALNALSMEMFQTIYQLLREWEPNPDVHAVVIQGAGDKAFCAGGDVKAVYDAKMSYYEDIPNAPPQSLMQQVFRQEYTLNHLIATYPKPYIAILDGIVMGGGMGISIHGSHRIVTEKVRMAMPETAIGFFPDVGASYFLTHLPSGKVGFYLAMTSKVIGDRDAIYTNLATHFVPSNQIPTLLEALAKADLSQNSRQTIAELIEWVATPPIGQSFIQPNQSLIDRVFAQKDTLAIYEILEYQNSQWATDTMNELRTKSPTSLRVTFEEMRRGATLTLAQCFEMEYRLSQHFMEGHDFFEGVRAALVDKDKRPVWKPRNLEGVSDKDVEAYFKPCKAGDLEL
ncbi:MAG: enoyl-CoA hydratase/isomerase family protein [Alphaproteobacteria bacterium]|jgi:enoyl-CoA hydratase|nr:enoyl-CoA hydratase/isomerase family protein [Alphaproteobacteria bacterium]MBT5389904.1 enoyl-CoA hydratase/isomerase family protein [Alphaproteobacteria bacterium]MBT5655160.1 enoyl-CoA hydratase/isomerase family protein [Alphaproteobacteria bacterium]